MYSGVCIVNWKYAAYAFLIGGAIAGFIVTHLITATSGIEYATAADTTPVRISMI